MKKIILSLFLCSSIISNNGFTQNKIISLTDSYGTSFLPSHSKPTFIIKDLSSYKNLDTNSYKLWTVRYLNFNDTQSIVESALEKKITKERIRNYLLQYKIDTTNVNYKKLIGNTLSIFVGIDFKGFKTVIVDVNHNKDFDDDKKYVFDLNKEKKYPIISYNINYYDGKKINKLSRKLTLNAYALALQKYNLTGQSIINSHSDEVLNVSFLDKSYKKGFVMDEGTRYWINLRADLLGSVKNDKILLAVRENDGNLTRRVYNYYPADTIYINRKIYKLEKVEDNRLYINKIGELSHDNGAINTLAPIIEGEEINTGKYISLLQKRGKFIIIDFWGSWCVPCINALPELVTLKNKYADKNIDFLSIAYDDLKDINKVKHLIAEKELKWEHLLESKNGSKKIITDYLVQAYPTTLLVDAKGVVVIRAIGASALEEIDNYLNKYYRTTN